MISEKGKVLSMSGLKLPRDDVVEDVLLGFGKLDWVGRQLQTGCRPDGEDLLSAVKSG